MNRDDIQGRVQEALAEQLGLGTHEVTPGARFEEDLDADSLDLVEVVLRLEEAFEIDIPEEEMQKLKTVGEAVDLVASKLGVPA
jgi:acyl carrier protein